MQVVVVGDVKFVCSMARCSAIGGENGTSIKATKKGYWIGSYELTYLFDKKLSHFSTQILKTLFNFVI